MNPGGDQITAVIPTAAVNYVRRALGEPAVETVLARAGLRSACMPTRAGGEDWFDLETASAIIDAAAEACTDPAIGRRIGEQYFFEHRDAGVTNFLLAQADPAAAMELAVPFASRMSTSRRFEVVETSETSVRVKSYDAEPTAHRQWLCDIAVGYWSNIPSLFGALGSVVEVACEARGHDHCEFVMRWDRPVSLVGADADRSRVMADEALARFEDFQEMVAELLLADDVETVLAVIARRVRSAVMAPQVLLTVRSSDGERPHVVSIGMDVDEAERASDALWEGRPVATDRHVLTAPIASPHRLYGHLATVLALDAQPLEMDARLLTAYARNATTAVERAVSMEDAKRNHSATDALLGLARSLASATSVDEVCQKITDAVPDVVGCDIGGVWLWNAETASLVLRAASEHWSTLGRRELGAADVGSLAEMVSDPRAVVATGANDPVVAALLEEWGVKESYAAPIQLRGAFLGLVSAASRVPINSEIAQARSLDRLAALADQASTALDSSMLLEQVLHQALHDGLTQLPNRSLAESKTRDALALAATSGASAALLFVDLDRFKNVNDTLGHAAGDALICQVADRLAGCVRASDTVARLGGDEFFVLLPHISATSDAVAVAEKVIEAVKEPFEIHGEAVYISSSIGIACYPEHGHDYTSLMQHADVAMYQAKAWGRATYAVHAEEFSADRRFRLQLEGEMHLAVERDELVVEYQPQVDLATSRIVAVEALVRWQHPTLGRLAPDAFLAVAEESGVIVEIDRWVRRAALAQAKRWVDAGTPVRMALNLSTRELQNPALAAEIAELIADLDLDPGLVELEVTDRVVMSTADLPQVMTDLRAIGVRLAIDDFGTGSSVLSRLQHCPVDVLKIDRSFISELTGADADARLVHALISMAHALGLAVVAEGIETAAQATILRRYSCDIGQGFLYSKPVDAREITSVLCEHNTALTTNA